MSERELYQDLLSNYQTMKSECRYNANRLLNMVSNSKDIVHTVKDLIYRVDSYGYLKLLEMNRLDLTVEHLVVYKYSHLFTEDDLNVCRQKLFLEVVE